MPILINDNAPGLLALKGQQVITREVKDDKEFYALLKQKIISDLDRMSGAEVFEDKLKHAIDAHLGMGEFLAVLGKHLEKIGKNLPTEISDRRKLTGGFTKRLAIDTGKDTTKQKIRESLEEIRSFGEQKGYPSMVLRRNEMGNPYMTLLPGKDSWDKQIVAQENTEELLDSTNYLAESVRRSDINEEKERR